MVDALLINPQSDLKTRNRDSIPLGLACIGSILESNGRTVSCLDLCAGDYGLDSAVRYIAKKQPSVIGVSVFSASLRQVRELSLRVRSAGFNSPIVFGGHHITSDPTILPFLGGDYALLGEADYSFLKLLDCLVGGGDVRDVPGIVHTSEDSVYCGVPQIVEARLIPEPLRRLFNSSHYNYTSVHTSRGCPYNCIYCSVSRTRFRQRVVDDVLRELRGLYGLGVRKLDFVDDVFTLDAGFVESLCRRMSSEGLRFSWACTTRADLVDDSLFKVMRDSGLRHVSFGVESGSEDIRHAAGKTVSNERYGEVFNLCRRLGIKTRAYGMFGLPGESLKDLYETIDFIRYLKPDSAVFQITDLVPASPLFARALSDGLMDEMVWQDYVSCKRDYPVYVPQGLDLFDLVKALNKANKVFGNTP